MTHVVTGPLALVKDQAGKVRYYYTGASIPGEIPAEQLKRLVGRGLISRVADPFAAVAAEPVGSPVSTDTPDAAPEPTVPPERPSQVATKALWVDYAVSRGADRQTAEAMTKQELIDAYPPPE